MMILLQRRRGWQRRRRGRSFESTQLLRGGELESPYLIDGSDRIPTRLQNCLALFCFALWSGLALDRQIDRRKEIFLVTLSRYTSDAANKISNR